MVILGLSWLVGWNKQVALSLATDKCLRKAAKKTWNQCQGANKAQIYKNRKVYWSYCKALEVNEISAHLPTPSSFSHLGDTASPLCMSGWVAISRINILHWSMDVNITLLIYISLHSEVLKWLFFPCKYVKAICFLSQLLHCLFL